MIESPPAPTYTPNLPKAVVTNGLLSLAQPETVVYAGQAQDQMLPGDKERRGYFIGDGTGVGKGREIAGVILDNMRLGARRRSGCQPSRAWSATPGATSPACRTTRPYCGTKQDQSDGVISAKDGILFTTYDTLASGMSPLTALATAAA